MRWLRGAHIWVLGWLIAVAGCGSDVGDRLTLSFIRFTGEGIEQADSVRDTSADVDIVPGICAGGEEGGLEPEPFTQTSVVAVFVNRGKADILLDRYTLSAPDTGVPDTTRSLSATIIGGRCSNDAQRACALNEDCGLGQCQHRETQLTVLLYDFDFKQRVEPGTANVLLTFTGTDTTRERFTVSAGYVSSFDNFDNCEAAGGR